MFKIGVGAAFCLLLLSGPAMAVCSTYPYTLTNGTTADATQVMGNFNCAALTSGATIDGATINSATTIGIGMAPSNILDITQNQNTTSRVQILNSNGGGSAYTAFVANNGTYTAGMYLTGTGATTVGALGPNMAQFSGTPAGVMLYAPGTSPIIFAGTNSITEWARFGTDGSFLVGTATNGGWSGVANAEFYGSASRYALSVYNSYSSGSNLLIRTDNSAGPFATFYYQTGAVGSITTTGSVTAYNTTSDARLKSVLPNQKDYRSSINGLWVGDFEWKKDHSRSFGVLAQQTYPFYPEAVTKPANPDDIWQVDYGKLAPLALWGVKDLYKISDSQAEHEATSERQMTSLVNEMAVLQHANDNQASEIKQLRTQVSELEKRLPSRTAGVAPTSERGALQ